MFAPMFLLPGQKAVIYNFLTVNYYLDGQAIGSVRYTLDPEKKQVTLYPDAGGYGPSQYGIISYSNFIHPIIGFESGWRDQNGTTYSGTDIEDNSWVSGITYINKPLGQMTGMLEMDTKISGYHSLGINIDGVLKESIYMIATGQIAHNLRTTGPNNGSSTQYVEGGHSAIISISPLISLPTAQTGRYIGVTVEFS